MNDAPEATFTNPQFTAESATPITGKLTSFDVDKFSVVQNDAGDFVNGAPEAASYSFESAN